MKLYTVSEAYISYLRSIDPKVLESHFVKHDRKYLYLGIRLNAFEYLIPLSSPDKADFKEDGGIRPSILPIFRMVSGDGRLLGKLLLNNMIPVPESERMFYEIPNETDEKYRKLVLRELRIIGKNREKIIRNAEVLYSQKMAGLEIGYIHHTVDFASLERACEAYSRRRV